jgi:hypothetical protein
VKPFSRDRRGLCIFGGRFQPFHIGHQVFLETHLATCSDDVIIGIVNPDPHQPWPGDAAASWLRFDLGDNPLNYWERVNCIRLAIANTTISSRIAAIVPSPRPSVNMEQANRFLPPQPRRFLLRGSWRDEVENWKAGTYRRHGEEVTVVKDAELSAIARLASGTLIRQLIAIGNPAWKFFVTDAVAEYLESIQFERRVQAVVPRASAEAALQAFISEDVLGSFAADLIEHGAETGSDNSDSIGADYRIVRKLRAAEADRNGDVEVLLTSGERNVLERVASQSFEAKLISIRPKFREVSRDLYETVMTAGTRERLLVALRGS